MKTMLNRRSTVNMGMLVFCVPPRPVSVLTMKMSGSGNTFLNTFLRGHFVHGSRVSKGGRKQSAVPSSRQHTCASVP